MTGFVEKKRLTVNGRETISAGEQLIASFVLAVSWCRGPLCQFRLLILSRCQYSTRPCLVSAWACVLCCVSARWLVLCDEPGHELYITTTNTIFSSSGYTKITIYSSLVNVYLVTPYTNQFQNCRTN